jgi:hypothetical protein
VGGEKRRCPSAVVAAIKYFDGVRIVIPIEKIDLFGLVLPTPAPRAAEE